MWIQNTSETDPHSYMYEATKAVVMKAQKKVWGFKGIEPCDLHDTGAVLYQLSHEALLQAGQERVQFELNFGCFITARITFTSIGSTCSIQLA